MPAVLRHAPESDLWLVRADSAEGAQLLGSLEAGVRRWLLWSCDQPYTSGLKLDFGMRTIDGALVEGVPRLVTEGEVIEWHLSAWGLRTRCVDWALRRDGEVIASHHAPPDQETYDRCREAEGGRVTRYELAGDLTALRLGFDTGWELTTRQAQTCRCWWRNYPPPHPILNVSGPQDLFLQLFPGGKLMFGRHRRARTYTARRSLARWWTTDGSAEAMTFADALPVARRRYRPDR